ncbi:MAG: spheroidene monooxygenase [Pseudorhodobacter sp. PARRP1]|nr:MAG: spheroidene monooxygenase [Pseudorhodobacter sp. PARRP1]
MNTVSLSLFRFASLPARLWVFGQMGAARLSFMRMPEVGFWKLCGSGTGEGFTPKPNTAVWAILATWPDAATARRVIDAAPVFRRWRKHSAENWTILLEPTSARGQWSGRAPFTATDTPNTGPNSGPIVALTRATMRVSTFLRFWRRVPDISAAIGQDPNVIFKIGIGEVPLLHQITFSIWPDAASMAHFARGDGPHGRAIQAVRAEGWFSEELYARFRILDDWGTWGGIRPLGQKDAA